MNLGDKAWIFTEEGPKLLPIREKRIYRAYTSNGWCVTTAYKVGKDSTWEEERPERMVFKSKAKLIKYIRDLKE